MIAQFPDFYPDELLYSLLARYYVRSGYMAYTYVAEELFTSKTVRPDIEFVNKFTTAALRAITRNITMEQVIEKHTMFPYYGRFLKKERKQNAFTSLVSMGGNYHNLLPMPKRKTDTKRHLRYCPICVGNDRERYGETYWHRIHQMTGVNICAEHHCRLIESNVLISEKASPTLVSAEEIIHERTLSPAFSDNEIECKLASYAAKVFQSKIDLKSEFTISQFLHSKMENTKYLSVRGEQRNIALFHADFAQYYKNLPDNHFTELWQIQKVLNGYRYNHHEVCMLAFFLNISVADLVNMKLPEKSQKQLFDEKIQKLHEKGLNYSEIAKGLNASYDTVKAIGEKRYGTYHKEPKKPLERTRNGFSREKEDVEMLPLVKDAIAQIQGIGDTRPKKVTKLAVEKFLNLPSKRIDKLPRCKLEIENNQETQAEYWAREIGWAVNKILSDDQPLNWKHIRSLTNMRKRDLITCFPYLDFNLRHLISELI